MSFYHALANPLQKEAALPLRAIGRSLWNRGLWGTAARGGEVLAARGGRFQGLGNAIQSGGNAMKDVSPYLAAYGAAGMVGQPLGYDLPGSSLAFNVGAPGWGALMTAPNAIRSARLSTGKYNDAIKADAERGASRAAQDWITATQHDGQTAYDPAAYVRFLQENGFDTEAAGKYFGEDPVRRPGMWKRLGNVFENPTGNVLPEVREQIHGRITKQASFDWMEKAAMALAARGAWAAARGAGTGVLRSSARAGGAAWKASAPGRFMTRHPNVGKWGGRTLNAGMLGLSAYDTADAVGSDTPYDPNAVAQEGYDGMQAAIRSRLAAMTPFERQMVQFDPSLAVNAMGTQMPGAVSAWEQANGMPYQRGFLGDMQNAWQSRGTPTFYSTDATGAPQYLK